jgi:hypothetical protein
VNHVRLRVLPLGAKGCLQLKIGVKVILNGALVAPVTKISVSIPARIASSTAYWISGLSTIGSNSFGMAFVAGKKRVPNPATGNTAFRTVRDISISLLLYC